MYVSTYMYTFIYFNFSFSFRKEKKIVKPDNQIEKYKT